MTFSLRFWFNQWLSISWVVVAQKEVPPEALKTLLEYTSEWIVHEGGSVSSKIYAASDQHGGIGHFAGQNIAKGETIAYIPSTVMTFLTLRNDTVTFFEKDRGFNFKSAVLDTQSQVVKDPVFWKEKLEKVRPPPRKTRTSDSWFGSWFGSSSSTVGSSSATSTYNSADHPTIGAFKAAYFSLTVERSDFSFGIAQKLHTCPCLNSFKGLLGTKLSFYNKLQRYRVATGERGPLKAEFDLERDDDSKSVESHAAETALFAEASKNDLLYAIESRAFHASSWLQSRDSWTQYIVDLVHVNMWDLYEKIASQDLSAIFSTKDSTSLQAHVYRMFGLDHLGFGSDGAEDMASEDFGSGADFNPELLALVPLGDFLNHGILVNAMGIAEPMSEGIRYVSIADIPEGDEILIQFGEGMLSPIQNGFVDERTLSMLHFNFTFAVDKYEQLLRGIMLIPCHTCPIWREVTATHIAASFGATCPTVVDDGTQILRALTTIVAEDQNTTVAEILSTQLLDNLRFRGIDLNKEDATIARECRAGICQRFSASELMPVLGWLEFLDQVYASNRTGDLLLFHQKKQLVYDAFYYTGVSRGAARHWTQGAEDAHKTGDSGNATNSVESSNCADEQTKKMEERNEKLRALHLDKNVHGRQNMYLSDSHPSMLLDECVSNLHKSWNGLEQGEDPSPTRRKLYMSQERIKNGVPVNWLLNGAMLVGGYVFTLCFLTLRQKMKKTEKQRQKQEARALQEQRKGQEKETDGAAGDGTLLGSSAASRASSKKGKKSTASSAKVNETAASGGAISAGRGSTGNEATRLENKGNASAGKQASFEDFPRFENSAKKRSLCRNSSPDRTGEDVIQSMRQRKKNK